MSKRKSSKATELPLFDLPLHANDEADDPAAIDPEAMESPEPVEPTADDPAPEPAETSPNPADRTLERPANLTLFPTEPNEPGDSPAAATTQSPSGEKSSEAASGGSEPPEGSDTPKDLEASEDPRPAPFNERLLTSVVDLAVHLAVLGVTAAAVLLMGLRLTTASIFPFLALGLVFSFLYWFIPLAFWGRTPGMAWVGHTALGLDEEPLTFSQTALRWIGALLTLAFAGLPLLLAFKGRSLSDRLSESQTIIDIS